MADGGDRLLVVRGDLNSASGYTLAILLYVQKLAPRYDAVVGVDLHFHPSRSMPRWPFPEVTDAEVHALAATRTHQIDVLTISTPPNYRRVADTRNVGLFFWETDRLGRASWIDAINEGVDEMWVPADFMVEMLLTEGATVPVRYVPCPLPDESAAPPDALGNLALQQLEPYAESPRLVTFEQIRATHERVYLSTGTLIPRKGLPLLAHEWCALQAIDPDAALILKVSSIDVTQSHEQLVEQLNRVWSVAAAHRPFAHVYLLVAQMSEAAMAALSSRTDAFVTTSLGEGFGLGVFESLLAGRPAFCPRHTSFAELLPADYRYFLDTDWRAIGLADPTKNYPISARWGAVRPGALGAAHERLVADVAVGSADAETQRALAFAHNRIEQQWAEAVS